MWTIGFENGIGRAYVDLAVDTETPAEARRALEELRESVPPEIHNDLRLLVTEVVTNVVRYAQFPPGAEPTVSLRVTVRNDHVGTEVCYMGDGFEPPLDPRPNEDMNGGWGLVIVDRLSERWGTRQENGLFCTWFELTR